MTAAAPKPRKPKPAKKQAEKVCIYRLVDPISGEVRYIGKAANMRRRLREHINPRAGSRMTPLKAWIASLKAKGHTPIMELIEECSIDQWADRERHHIAAYRANGFRLTNLADGGNQPYCDDETRKSNAAILNKSNDAPVFAIVRVLGKAKNRALESGNVDRANYFWNVMAIVSASNGVTRDRFREYGKKFQS